MTQTIVKALEMTGQRGIIQKGWGGLGNCKYTVPLFMILLVAFFTMYIFHNFISSVYLFLFNVYEIYVKYICSHFALG